MQNPGSGKDHERYPEEWECGAPRIVNNARELDPRKVGDKSERSQENKMSG